MDDDLEVFVASGLDIPTAIVASEKPGPPERRHGCGMLVVIAIVIVILSLIWRCR